MNAYGEVSWRYLAHQYRTEIWLLEGRRSGEMIAVEPDALFSEECTSVRISSAL
jgi:hypothetical protein